MTTASSFILFDAFSWKQIDSAFNIDELAQKEKEYVLQYNSKEEGYNSDEGGGIKKTVYQYNIDNGSLVKAYVSLSEAGDKIDATKQQISRACLNVTNIFGGFYWSYEFKEPFIPTKDKRVKKVIQFSLDWKFLSMYDSISKASQNTGVNKSSIAKVCRDERNHAGGFKWQYE